MSLSESWVDTFSITHARHIASRIAGDLRLMHRYYGYPQLDFIDDVLEEIAQCLAAGYLESFEIGYEHGNRERVFTLLYEALPDGTLSDNRAGDVPPYEDVSGATSFNYLTHNDRWFALSSSEREAFKAKLPVKRTSAPPLQDGIGYWSEDRSYGAGGVSVRRRRFVPYG